MTKRFVHLSPRLLKAAEMMKGFDTIADIGSDHGRLAAALLQKQYCKNVIATDISAESLAKAEKLISYIGLDDKVTFRVGNGLQVIGNGECDAIALLGIGGTLIRRILEQEQIPLKGAKIAVMQPMRAQAELRQYLHNNCFHITEDFVIKENQRFYQIFRAEKGEKPQIVPDYWPDSFYDIGFVSFEQKDPNLLALINQQLNLYSMKYQEAKGSNGEKQINKKIEAFLSLRKMLE